MLIAGVVCLGAAMAAGGAGVWTLTRPPTADPANLVMRATAPAQLGAAAMLAVGGAVALACPPRGVLVVVLVCVIGAVGTLTAASWQSGRYIARRIVRPETAPPDCVGSCATCTLSCH